MIKESDFLEKIHISENVKRVLKKYSRQTIKNYKEYGGILLGRVSDNGSVFIDIATIPNKLDISKSLSFLRNSKSSQVIIERLWKKSNGVINYLGEWHTHPFSSNIPSIYDKLMLNDSLSTNTINFDFIIMIIVDIHNHYSVTIINKTDLVTRGDIVNE